MTDQQHDSQDIDLQEEAGASSYLGAALSDVHMHRAADMFALPAVMFIVLVVDTLH